MKNHYFMEVTLLKEIDLSDKKIKEYFEFPNDYEVTEADRFLYFNDKGFKEGTTLNNADIIDMRYYISNPE